MNWLFRKQGYITWPLLCLAIIAFLHYKQIIFNQEIKTDILMDQAGNLLGFLLAFVGIIVALPQETYFIQFIARYLHHAKVIKRCLVVGMICFVFVIISSLTSLPGISSITYNLTIYAFIFGLAAMAVIMFYLLQLFSQKFRDIRKGIK